MKKKTKEKKAKKQRTLKQKIIMLLVGLVVFVILLNCVIWLLHKFVFESTFYFTFKWSIMYPVIFYAVVLVGYKIYKSFND